MIKVPKPPTDHADTALLAPSRYFSQKPLFQHVPRFLGRLFAGRNGRLTRKKSQGLRGTPNRCGVLRGQMAKVEQRDCPKRLGGLCNVALRVAQTPLFDPFRPPYTRQIHARSVASTHEKEISNRPLRRRVGVHRASPAYPDSRWAA
jgi:hypothetical protein